MNLNTFFPVVGDMPTFIYLALNIEFQGKKLGCGECTLKQTVCFAATS